MAYFPLTEYFFFQAPDEFSTRQSPWPELTVTHSTTIFHHRENVQQTCSVREVRHVCKAFHITGSRVTWQMPPFPITIVFILLNISIADSCVVVDHLENGFAKCLASINTTISIAVQVKVFSLFILQKQRQSIHCNCTRPRQRCFCSPFAWARTGHRTQHLLNTNWINFRVHLIHSICSTFMQNVVAFPLIALHLVSGTAVAVAPRSIGVNGGAKIIFIMSIIANTSVGWWCYVPSIVKSGLLSNRFYIIENQFHAQCRRAHWNGKWHEAAASAFIKW